MQFIDLAAQQARLRARVDAALSRVLDHGQYIMGPEVTELEERLAAFCGTTHCISCANGTDALQLVLMALGIGSGDAVFVPSFTFAATAEVVPLLGATPVFVDIDLATYTMDTVSLERAIAHARSLGLRPAAIIPVDLFGTPADYPTLTRIAQSHGMILVSDSAQGFGGMIDDRMTGSFGHFATTSFFPAKPLGCYGDGGAIFTDDSEQAALLDSLRVHGKGEEKYENVRIGMNSRLDTLQAAILLEKLNVYAEEIEARNALASNYSAALQNYFVTPHVPKGFRSIWAQYTLRAEDGAARDKAVAGLKAANVPTAIYYPRPLHEQTAFADFPADPRGLVNSTIASQCVFSIPMHPYLSDEDRDFVIREVLAAT